jgi:hypothetical protein
MQHGLVFTHVLQLLLLQVMGFPDVVLHDIDSIVETLDIIGQFPLGDRQITYQQIIRSRQLTSWIQTELTAYLLFSFKHEKVPSYGRGQGNEKPPEGGSGKNIRDSGLAFGVESFIFGFKFTLTPRYPRLVVALDFVVNPLAFGFRQVWRVIRIIVITELDTPILQHIVVQLFVFIGHCAPRYP